MPSTETLSQTGDEVRVAYFESRATGVEIEDPPPSDDPEPWDPEKIRVHGRTNQRIMK